MDHLVRVRLHGGTAVLDLEGDPTPEALAHLGEVVRAAHAVGMHVSVARRPQEQNEEQADTGWWWHHPDDTR